MKWLAALGGLLIGGMVFSPAVGLVLGILGAVFVPNSFRREREPGEASSATPARSLQHPFALPRGTAEAEPEEALAELREQVLRLERRLARVEHDLAQLKTDPKPATAATPGAATAAPPAALAPAMVVAPLPAASAPVVVPLPAQAAGMPAARATLDLPLPAPSAPVPVAAAPTAPAVTAPAPTAWAEPPRRTAPPLPPVPPAKTFAERLPAPLRNLIFGGNTLVKVGVLLLFLGLAFLLRYAAERVSVPLPLRYAGVMGVGVVLLGLGWRLRGKRASYALILQGAGIGVFYLTTLAAMKLHALIPPTAGFAFLFGVAVLSAVLAVLQNAMALAVVAALEGFAAPVLVSTGSNNPLGLFTYLTVLNLGIFVVAWFKAWRPLHLIGLVGTLTLAGAWAQTRYTPEHFAVTQTFLIVFGVMFSIIGLLFARRTLLENGDETMAQRPLAERAAQTLQRVGRVDSALVFGTPLSAYGLQYLLVQDKPLGPALAAVAFGLFQLLLARLALAQRNAGLSLLAESYVVVAVLFGTLAIPLGLEGRWTGAAWAVEAAGMFWLGLRQQRPYARVFALAVMGGATYKLLQEVAPSFAPGTPWLTGSSLGPVLLAGAAGAIWWLSRKLPKPAELAADSTADTTASRLAPLEALGVSAMPWLAGAALNLLPWLWLMPATAPMGSTVLALAFWLIGERFTRAELKAHPNRLPESTPFASVSAALHGVAALGLLSTLQFSGDKTVLAHGHSALLTTLWVAAGLLVTVWRAVLLARAASGLKGPMVWTSSQQLAVLAAAALLHLAPLFVMDWQDIAWLWPLMGSVSLWAALRMGLAPLAGLAAAVQLGAFVVHYLSGWGDPAPGTEPPLFLSQHFFTSLVQVLAWIVSAGLLHAAERRPAEDERRPMLPALLASPLVLWAPLLAGIAGWVVHWFTEFGRAAYVWGHPHWHTGLMVLVLLATGLLMRGVARVRQWPQMALASLAVLPGLALVALSDAATGPSSPFMPSHDLGLLAWPLALAWHLWALRRWPAEAPVGAVRTATHVGGLWLFTALAALELVARVQALSLSGTAWLELSAVAVLAAVLYGLSRPGMAQRWPVRDVPSAYLEVAALPLVALSGLWLMAAGLLSAGDAAPLPYVPLLNPLELGLAGVILTLLQWQGALPADSRWRLPQGLGLKLVAAAGLGLLTGMVLRACHHWAGVAWSAEALFASRLTQAALSLAWATCGVLAMVLGNRRASRGAWVAGAALLGVVVAKLFFVELADHGGIYRIVSFMGVGVLLLAVGYFAPVPASKNGDAAPPAPPAI